MAIRHSFGFYFLEIYRDSSRRMDCTYMKFFIFIFVLFAAAADVYSIRFENNH